MSCCLSSKEAGNHTWSRVVVLSICITRWHSGQQHLISCDIVFTHMGGVCTWVIFFSTDKRYLMTADLSRSSSFCKRGMQPRWPFGASDRRTSDDSPRDVKLKPWLLWQIDILQFYSWGSLPCTGHSTLTLPSYVTWTHDLDNHYMCLGAKTLWEGSPTWFFIFFLFLSNTMLT